MDRSRRVVGDGRLIPEGRLRLPSSCWERVLSCWRVVELKQVLGEMANEALTVARKLGMFVYEAVDRLTILEGHMPSETYVGGHAGFSKLGTFADALLALYS